MRDFPTAAASNCYLIGHNLQYTSKRAGAAKGTGFRANGLSCVDSSPRRRHIQRGCCSIERLYMIWTRSTTLGGAPPGSQTVAQIAQAWQACAFLVTTYLFTNPAVNLCVTGKVYACNSVACLPPIAPIPAWTSMAALHGCRPARHEQKFKPVLAGAVTWCTGRPYPQQRNQPSWTPLPRSRGRPAG